MLGADVPVRNAPTGAKYKVLESSVSRFALSADETSAFPAP
jgi:hypothetical protein